MAQAPPPAFNFKSHPAASPFTVPLQEYLDAHPDAGFQYIATGAVVFDTTTNPSAPRVLLVQRAAKDTMPNKWETPGGACDAEDPSILHAVARELWEEARLEAVYIGPPVSSPQVFASASGKLIGKFVFEVRVHGGVEPRLDPDEHQRFVWASEKEVMERRAGEVDLEFTSKQMQDCILLVFEQNRRKE